MRIPVFVSAPTALNDEQAASYAIVLEELANLQLEPRRLGVSDYPRDYPLREVAVIARHCSGGIILGFEQFRSQAAVWKHGSASERTVTELVRLPTPWNHLEAGILFGLKLPLLIFREPGIAGGVFDEGVTDVFVNKMPMHGQSPEERRALTEIFLKWRGRVSEHYSTL